MRFVTSHYPPDLHAIRIDSTRYGQRSVEFNEDEDGVTSKVAI